MKGRCSSGQLRMIALMVNYLAMFDELIRAQFSWHIGPVPAYSTTLMLHITFTASVDLDCFELLLWVSGGV
jgi:hypothetical protein